METTKSVDANLITPATKKGLKEAIKMLITFYYMLDKEKEIPAILLKKPVMVYVDLKELQAEVKESKNQDIDLS